MKRRLEAPEKIFKDITYNHYIVQYQGNIENDMSHLQQAYVTPINVNYAIMSIKYDEDIYEIAKESSTIVYVKPADMYTLQLITPTEATEVRLLQSDIPLNLTGKGVDVAIIDTGIDYLSEEFMNSNGETRIKTIYDQTIFTSEDNVNIEKEVPYGTVYKKEQIQQAINDYKAGKNPYEIVPSKDEVGHGTNMASIIGATGKRTELKGMVYECEFIVVKLIEDFAYEEQFKTQVKPFNITTVFVALEFLYRYALKSNRPMVICFPLGSNLGNHKKSGILEKYIEDICLNSGIALVTGTGNERANGEHTSGQISQVGEYSVVEVEVDQNQRNLWLEFWVDLPNIMSLEIISPSGETTKEFPPLINSTSTYKFMFEKASVKVNYYLPEEITGDELIRIRMYDLQPGIWKFRLKGEIILDGKYNVWITQKGITIGETKFSLSDPYGTITNPGNSTGIITAAAYNQSNKNVLKYSGMHFSENYVDVIDIAAGGVNALVASPGNTIKFVNGTSVAAAIVTGACALLFQWGIVDGNNTYMHNTTLKTYLDRGTEKRKGDIYPNPQWGYGILNVFTMFQNMI